MDISEAKRLKALEDENAKLKRLLAEAMLDNVALKDLLGKKVVTPIAEREAVAHLMAGHGMSDAVARQAIAKKFAERGRACRVLGCCRMTARDQIVRVDNVDLREGMKALSHKRRRLGYRRLHVLLRRECHMVNHKRLFRMYREEKLHVRQRGGRKRAIGTRAPMLVPMAPNQHPLSRFAGKPLPGSWIAGFCVGSTDG